MKNGCDESETPAKFRAHRHQINFPTINNERVKLFGRNKELKRLRKCYSDLMQSPTNNKAAVFVSGVHGVGKTALVEEFLRQPFNRRRTTAGHSKSCRQRRGGNNNDSSSQLDSVIRCTFTEDQDDYRHGIMSTAVLEKSLYSKKRKVIAIAIRLVTILVI